jgi:tetratricopeptide (TPR) repeat protein
VVEWSHQLLTADEAALFARLAVFPGSFGLDQVEAVCADERLPTPSIAPLLARLVEQSLVRRVHDRFGMLETLRVHAGERLDALGDRVAWQARHARVTADRLAAHSARLWTPEEPAAVRALTELSDDLHAAWLYASRYDRPLAVRMAADVHDFAYGRQRLDLLRWGNAVAGWEAAREVAGPGGDLARALATAATAAWSSGRRAEAAALAERGVRLAGGPDSPAAVQALRVRAHLAMFDGRADEAAASYRTLAASLRAGGEPTRALVFEHAAAQALLYAGRAREAAAVVDALRAEVAGTGHPTTMAWASYVSGLVAEATEPDRALAAYAAAVEHGAAADCRLFVTLARSSAAALTARTGAHAEACAALGVVLDLWAQLSNEFMQWWVLAQVVVVLAALGRDRDAADLGAAVMAAGDRRPHVGTEEARLAAALDELRGRLGPGLMTPRSAGVGPGLAEAVALARRAMAAAGVAAARP